MSIRIAPPVSEAQLLQRCKALAGLSLGQVAAQLKVATPDNRVRAKGWAGQLLERYLGASAGPLPEPDFQALGIELKTIPVNPRGKAKEATFVCSAHETSAHCLSWTDSAVKRKLNRVLWLPVEAAPGIALGSSRVGRAFLWSPTHAQSQALEQDWQELAELLRLGEFDKLSPAHGQYLQVRPKAATRSLLARAAGEADTGPARGFYLRTLFTNILLDEYLR